MTKKVLLFLVLVSMLATLLTSCTPSTTQTDSGSTAQDSTVDIAATETPTETPADTQGSDTGTPADENTTIKFVDSAGREVEIPKNIDRIVPSGSLAQIVLLSIAPDKLVGLSGKWSDAATEFIDSKYLDLPVFGQFYSTDGLNMESLAAADPQLIIDIGEPKKTIVEDMDGIQEQLGIPTIFVKATLETMDECYTTLGEILGLQEEGTELADYCHDIYQNTVNTMASIGEDNKVSLLYCTGDSGSNVIAKTSFHAEVLDMLANNVAIVDSPSSKGTGNEVSMEQIYLWDPDVIIFAPGSVYSTVGEDKTWLELKAISSGNYYEVPAQPYNWMGFPPSVNRYIGMIWLSNTLYPDKFNYDLYVETAKYYKLFYHCDLSREQFDELTVNAIPKN